MNADRRSGGDVLDVMRLQEGGFTGYAPTFIGWLCAEGHAARRLDLNTAFENALGGARKQIVSI